MGLFDKIKEAKASQGSTYIKQGNYYLRVNASKTGETRKNKEYALHEFTVVRVLHDQEQYPADDQHRAGQSCTHMLMEGDSFLGNVKAMVMALFGLSEEEVTSDYCEEMFSADQPLAGQLIQVECMNIETKAGNTFTKVKYIGLLEPAEVLEADEIKRYFPEKEDDE